MCQGFNNLFRFLHHFVLAKLATSSMKVKHIRAVYTQPVQSIPLIPTGSIRLYLMDTSENLMLLLETYVL